MVKTRAFVLGPNFRRRRSEWVMDHKAAQTGWGERDGGAQIRLAQAYDLDIARGRSRGRIRLLGNN